MGNRYDHDSDSVGKAVGFERAKQKATIEAFNDALQNSDEDTSKSKILEATLNKLKMNGTIKNTDDGFFAAFFLAQFITERDSDGATKDAIRAVARKFASTLSDKGFNLEDLPLKEMIKDMQEKHNKECVADGCTNNSEEYENHINSILSMDPKDFISKEKLLVHINNSENDF
jgi:hypothetical protein